MIKKVIAIFLFTIFSISFSLKIPSSSYAFSSDFTKGANIRPASVDDFSSTTFQQSVTKLQQDGANFVTLVLPWYQTNTTSTDMLHGNDTPSDASVINAITFAHSLGLKVMLKPHIDPFSGEWRAMINPPDRATWFGNYGNMLVHYAQIAQQNNVEAMCLGTELYNMASPKANASNTGYWNTMIQNVKNNYRGQLTYDAQHSGQYSEINDVTFWNQMDFIGISGYYPLSGSSVTDFQNAWDKIHTQQIKPVVQKWGKPIWFTEVGYKSISNAQSDPGNWQMGGGIDLQNQANLYQALFSYWTNQTDLKGITFWEWTSNPNGGGANNSDYTPQNKPAENIIKQWYGQNGSGVAITPTPSSTQAAASSYSVNATVTPQNPGAGQQVSATIGVTPNGSLSDGIIDVEIYNNNTKVNQQFFDHQNLPANQLTNFTVSFTPQTTGNYTIKTGIFSSNWASTLFWNDNVVSFTVGNASSSVTPTPSLTPSPTPTISAIVSITPTPTPTSSTTSTSTSINIWWPSNNASITGTQPFKAAVSNLALNQYQMFWQVDGGQLNQMSDSQTDAPHKEALVNVSGWHWKGSGPYTINFVAKDGQGNVIAQKSASITISN